MEKMFLGRTGLKVCRSGFGALPIQRIPIDEAVRILRKAYESGIDFFDTARAYSDSEEKLGAAFHGTREGLVIATKSGSLTRLGVLSDIEKSLGKLERDYVDILQLHNPPSTPDFEDPEGAYAGLLDARKKGMARYIGITCHKRSVAMEAARSGLYDTIQFPISSISSGEDLAIIDACRGSNLGLIAMKAMAGGLISSMAAGFAFLRQYENVIPIWGIQRESELLELIELESSPPVLSGKLLDEITRDRAELSGLFCRGCGYCMPCPEGIEISWCARMSLLLRRAPHQFFLTDEWKGKMGLIKNCTHCGQCLAQCPYGIDTPGLLERNLADYEEFYAANT